ncbi:MAG: hypothetical protein RLZZ502_218 [Pseudomonadota bacterium]
MTTQQPSNEVSMTNTSLVRALVTGGSGAIGSAICRELASQGLHVLVHAHQHSDKAQALVKEIIAAGGSAEVICFDITHRQQCQQLLEQLQVVQVLVHNAGINDDTLFAAMTPKQWDSVIDVSLNGFYNLTQPLLMPMLRSRWGRIIAVSSVAAVMGNKGQVNYAAAKAGLHGACKALALEVASRNVTVNVVAPGIIESPMIEGVFDAQTIAQMVPCKRAGTPAEVASLVGYLASPAASYLTGQIISVNGGMA